MTYIAKAKHITLGEIVTQNRNKHPERTARGTCLWNTPSQPPRWPRAEEEPLLEDHCKVTGFSCLLPCKANLPTRPSVLLSLSSTKEKQEQILHDSTVSQARSICSNLCTVIQVKKLALSWCLSQSVKYIQAPSVQFPLIFSLTCLFTKFT